MRGSERRVGVYGRLNWHRILWRHGASSPSSSGNGGVKWWLCAVCYNEVLHLSQSCTSAFALNYTLLSFEFSWLINDGMNENGRSRFSTLDVDGKWSDSRTNFVRVLIASEKLHRDAGHFLRPRIDTHYNGWSWTIILLWSMHHRIPHHDNAKKSCRRKCCC